MSSLKLELVVTESAEGGPGPDGVGMYTSTVYLNADNTFRGAIEVDAWQDFDYSQHEAEAAAQVEFAKRLGKAMRMAKVR